MSATGSIDLDSDPCCIIGMRVFDAPRELVFAAFTDPKHLAQWWGPIGFTTTTSAFDFRPGGSDVEPVQFTQRLTFEDLGNGKTRLTWRGTFPSAEQRARVIKEYGADKGLVQCLARLAEFVAARAR